MIFNKRLVLARETLCRLSDDRLGFVQGAMPKEGQTDGCDIPTGDISCQSCLIATCTLSETGTGTSVLHPTLPTTGR